MPSHQPRLQRPPPSLPPSLPGPPLPVSSTVWTAAVFVCTGICCGDTEAETLLDKCILASHVEQIMQLAVHDT